MKNPKLIAELEIQFDPTSHIILSGRRYSQKMDYIKDLVCEKKSEELAESLLYLFIKQISKDTRERSKYLLGQIKIELVYFVTLAKLIDIVEYLPLVIESVGHSLYLMDQEIDQEITKQEADKMISVMRKFFIDINPRIEVEPLEELASKLLEHQINSPTPSRQS